jgi:hypothetical protein
VIEGAVYPGAENWSGAVYFCETLARPEILGPELLKQCAFERRVVKRGLLVSDGVVAVGGAVRSPSAFEHAYTVLRPVFDRDLAEKARMLGAEILSDTTALGLLPGWRPSSRSHDVAGSGMGGPRVSRGRRREPHRVARGPRAHRTPKERGGSARVPPGREGSLGASAAEIEKRFGVEAGEGACFEILLRNGSFDGKTVPLNAGAFLYTNRESISLGFVAPLANLAQFGGDHNTLMEWLKGLAPLRGLLEGAKPVSFGAKLIRGGGHREMPTLCLDGLVVGGAAAGLGVDFPCPNYTGPATHCGWLVSEAVHAILRDGKSFDRATLEALYVEPLKRSVGYRDSTHLADWPHAISGAREFFGRQCDLVAGAASVIADPDAGVVGRHVLFARHLVETLPIGAIPDFAKEMKHVGAALRADRGAVAAVMAHLPLRILNTLRLMIPFGASTGAVFEAGASRRSRQAAAAGPVFDPLSPVASRAGARRRAAPSLCERRPRRLRETRGGRGSVSKTLSLLEVVLIPLVLLLNIVVGYLHRAAFFVWVAARKPKLEAILATYAFRKKEERRRANDWRRVKDVVPHDDKLAAITYRGDPASHIGFHVRPDKNGLPKRRRRSSACAPRGSTAKRGIHRWRGPSRSCTENCVRCETCWRADSDHVDWGRTRGQRLVFEAYSPAEASTAESVDAAAIAWLDRRSTTTWTAPVPTVSEAIVLDPAVRARVVTGLARLRVAVEGFRPLHAGALPVLLGADQDLLAKTAEDAFRTIERIVEALAGAASSDAGLAMRLDALTAFVALARPRVKTRRFFDLESDFDLLATHHLPDLEARLAGVRVETSPSDVSIETLRDRVRFRRALEARLTKEVVAASESEGAPTDDAMRVVVWATRAVADAAARGDEARRAVKAVVLEELGRISPGLAYAASGRLTALDICARPIVGDSSAAETGAVAPWRHDLHHRPCGRGVGQRRGRFGNLRGNPRLRCRAVTSSRSRDGDWRWLRPTPRAWRPKRRGRSDFFRDNPLASSSTACARRPCSATRTRFGRLRKASRRTPRRSREASPRTWRSARSTMR